MSGELLEIKPKTEVVTPSDDLPESGTVNCEDKVVENLDNNEVGKNSEDLTTKSEPATQEDTAPDDIANKILFRAVGVLRVELNLDPYPSFKLGGKEYKLFYAANHKRSLYALKQQIANFGAEQRIIVYPRVLHLPDRNKPPVINSFQLVGFDDGVRQGVGRELDDNEFKLFGLWQFIAVCKCPVISIYRNFTPEQYAHFKSLDEQQKKYFGKAQHIPVFWKDALVPPFRFNPKLDKEQQAPRYFVGVKARFLPGRDSFGFDSLLAPPTLDAPKFIKIKKPEQSGKGSPTGKGKKNKKVRTSKKVVKSKNNTEAKSFDKSSGVGTPKVKPKKKDA